MQTENAIALKEWAVVCRALELGRQTLILRKGGIHEDGGEFRLAHNEFRLFPTYEHQRREAVMPDARPLFDEVMSLQAAPHPGPLPAGEGGTGTVLETVRIGLHATVEEEHVMTDPSSIPGLVASQILSEETVLERFYYHTPGLFVLVLRVYRLAEPYELPNSPEFAGCRSWVDLRELLSTRDVKPVLDDNSFLEQTRNVRRLLRTSGYA